MDRVLSCLELADELIGVKREVERGWLPKGHARLLEQAIFKLRHFAAAEDAEERQNAGGTREASGGSQGDEHMTRVDGPLYARVAALEATVASMRNDELEMSGELEELASSLTRLSWFVAGERLSGEVDEEEAQRRAQAASDAVFGKNTVRRSGERRSGVDRRKSKTSKRIGCDRGKLDGA